MDKGMTYFSYIVVAGVPDNYTLTGSASTLGIPAASDAGIAQPWYYAIARGDIDGKGTPFTELNVTSHRSTVVVLNEGQ